MYEGPWEKREVCVCVCVCGRGGGGGQEISDQAISSSLEATLRVHNNLAPKICKPLKAFYAVHTQGFHSPTYTYTY